MRRCGSHIVDLTVSSRIFSYDLFRILEELHSLERLSIDECCLEEKVLKWLTIISDKSNERVHVPLLTHIRVTSPDEYSKVRPQPCTSESLVYMLCSRTLLDGGSNPAMKFETLKNIELSLPWDLDAVTVSILELLRGKGVNISVSPTGKVRFLRVAQRCSSTDFRQA
jgi:hypothetical protein